METINQDLRQYKITVLSKPVLSKYGERFAIDFETARPVNERVPLDYNHEDGEIIGYCDAFSVEDNSVTATAHLVLRDDVPTARANEVAALIDGGVPFEASPLIDLETAEAVYIPAVEQTTVNGSETYGPLTVYRGAVIRGVAVCPHGTDSETRFVAFKANNKEELNKMADDKQASQAHEPRLVVNAELEAMVQEFGKDRGVDYYLSGKTIEEARADDYKQLKAWKEEQEAKEAQAAQEAQEKLNAANQQAADALAQVEALNNELKELKASYKVGDPIGLSAAIERKPEKKPALMAMADYYAKKPAVKQ